MNEFDELPKIFSIEIISILEQFIEHENRAINKYKKKDYIKYKELIDTKKINDPIEVLKRDQKLSSIYRNLAKDDYSEKSLFVYTHSIFERYFNKLITLGIKNVLPVRKKYFEFILKKNERLVQEGKKLFDSEFLLMSEEERINKSIDFLPRIFEDIGYIDLAKKLFDIKESDQFTRLVRFYYESKERRNLLIHRGLKYDQTYIVKVNSKRINLLKIFSEIEKIKTGEKVKIHSMYLTQLIFIMITIFYRSHYHLMVLNKINIDDVGNFFASDMHNFFENINSIKSKFINFHSALCFFMISNLFELFEKDFELKNNIIFTTNHLLAIKRSSKKIDLNILKSKSNLYQGNNLHKSIYKILEGKYKEALNFLKQSKDEDGADEKAFHDWEIFREVKNMREFKQIYKKKFGRIFKKLN